MHKEPVTLDPRAERVFRSYLAEAAAGRAQDFEALCRAHPELEGTLRSWKQALVLFGSLQATESSQQTVAAQAPTARDADHTAELDGQAAKEVSSASSSLVERLRAAGPRGTRYKMLGEVARGGMGAILRIWDEELRRTLAMKVVLGKGAPAAQESSDADPKTVGRFLEEAQITGQLDHPGIVPVHELGLDATGRVYFTMRLVKGEDLRTILEHVRAQRDGWTQIRALNILLRVCEAMAYAHSKQVIHRDLKPANVMVGKYGEVYVMDWGLARAQGREDKHDVRIRQPQSRSRSAVEVERHLQRDDSPDAPLVTMDGDIVGTPSFMAPEQARGQLDRVGPHSDVYSIGAMLYQLLGGTVPFVPVDSRVSAYTILHRLLEGPPKPVRELAPSAPDELVAICEKAMAREIAQRYATTLELAEDLRAYVEGRVVRAYESGAWAEAKKWVRRNKPLAAALAAGVLVAAAGAVAVAIKAREATAARDELAHKNVALEATNTELAAAEELARRNAEQAELSAKVALEKEHEALAARAESEQRANDVLALSAQKDLDDLIVQAEDLWPAHPHMLAALDDWLARAKELLEGRPADEARGLKRRPGLAEHRAKLAELRARARPLTAAQVAEDRRTHLAAGELQNQRAQVTWYRRLLGLEPWPDAALAEAELAKETLPTDAAELIELAFPLVDTSKPASGREQRALLLAHRAVAAAGDARRARAREVLAVALFRLGRWDEALAEIDAALAEPSGGDFASSAETLRSSIASWRAAQLAPRRAQLEKMELELTALDARVGERRTFDYDEPEDAWWDRQLAKLIADLETLQHPQNGVMGDTLRAPFGWGVTKRRDFARNVRERTVDGPEAQRAWAQAIAAIQTSAKYGGLVLKPHLGLLPIGCDPQSELWEFVHLQSGAAEGAIPARDALGRLELTEQSGLVLVLIPRGTTWIGATRMQNGRNFDALAKDDETPVHELESRPYFLSKFEMTQNQWERMAGHNPSLYTQSTYDENWNAERRPWSGLHPVESATWAECSRMMQRIGLTLPSESQWERGCRAETSTPYSSGELLESLAEVANLSDAFARDHGGPYGHWEPWNDGNTCHTRVGSYRANAYGLHDMHGNVSEWCSGDYLSYKLRIRHGYMDATEPRSAMRARRGGSFSNAAVHARSSARAAGTVSHKNFELGLRPARLVER